MSNALEAGAAGKMYPLGKDFMGGVRLYLQHWMWRRTLGYLLHPSIPKLDEGAKVADLCCGTGIWLLDLAKEQPHVKCQGFDISTSQFPAKEWLPSNVELSTIDVLKPIPEELVGQFDVIHVGIVVAVVQKDDPHPLLQNILKMLKPGGYIQWDEADLGGLYRQPANPDLPNDEVEAMYDKLWAALKAPGITFEWVRNLDKVFEQDGLEPLANTLYKVPDDIAHAWSHQQLLTIEEVLEHFARLQADTTELWALYRRMREQVLAGISVRMSMVVAVGRKQA